LNLNKKNNSSKGLNFIFISSNYIAKGVDIVLKAWQEFCVYDKYSTLTLISHDIPKFAASQLERVEIIKKIPLNNKLKNLLYSKADVAIATTLTDGITPVEAMSYGLPVIVFRSQHSKDFVRNNNGIEIDVPINVYDKGYGVEWKTNESYIDKIIQYNKIGLFNNTINNLINAFKLYSDNRKLLALHKKNAINLFNQEHTIEKRNKKLLEIYDEVY
jgi:glycosyltransferase involved in cell wall biosynthesis